MKAENMEPGIHTFAHTVTNTHENDLNHHIISFFININA